MCKKKNVIMQSSNATKIRAAKGNIFVLARIKFPKYSIKLFFFYSLPLLYDTNGKLLFFSSPLSHHVEQTHLFNQVALPFSSSSLPRALPNPHTAFKSNEHNKRCFFLLALWVYISFTNIFDLVVIIWHCLSHKNSNGYSTNK